MGVNVTVHYVYSVDVWTQYFEPCDALPKPAGSFGAAYLPATNEVSVWSGISGSTGLVNEMYYAYLSENMSEPLGGWNYYHMSGYVTSEANYFDDIQFDGQQTIQLPSGFLGGDYVACAMPQIKNGSNPFGTSNQALLLYDLNGYGYIPENTFNVVQRNEVTGSCVTFNPLMGLLYVVGGDYGGSNGSSAAYDFIADTWSYFPLLVREFHGCAMDAASQYIFVFGGKEPFFNATIQDTITMYDTWAASPEWTNVTTATLRDPVVDVACILFDGIDDKIYCFGGYLDVNVSYVEVYSMINIFDPATMTVNDSALQLSVARYQARVIQARNCILVLGGRILDAGELKVKSQTDTIECYCLPYPTTAPTSDPTMQPSSTPTKSPSYYPTKSPSFEPTVYPTSSPSMEPTMSPSNEPTPGPSVEPTNDPSRTPTKSPLTPTYKPSAKPITAAAPLALVVTVLLLSLPLHVLCFILF
jgi:hypothetical protein